ncbi:MAG: hypothetical protein J7L88_06655 [Thermoplasmata archaeon]|nr:hypothetical protein [Thermoplasmata archaeon]
MTSIEVEEVLLDLLKNVKKNLLILHTPEVSSLVGEVLLKPEKWINSGKTLFIGPVDRMRRSMQGYEGSGELFLADLNDVVFTLKRDPEELEEFSNFIEECTGVVILNYHSLFEPLRDMGVLLRLEESFQKTRIVLTQTFLSDGGVPLKIWREPLRLDEAIIVYGKKKYGRAPLQL